MKKAKVQIIVEADEPALFFRSKAAAEAYLEAYDIDEGVYPVAFDRSGQVYTIEVRGNSGLLVPNAEQRHDTERLRSTIIKFLNASKVRFLPDDTLDDLLAKCEQFLRA